MSLIDRSIGNALVIPRVETDAFEQHPESLFALGVIAVGEEPMSGCGDVVRGYRALRWNVYGPQTNQIDTDHLDDDGTEKWDEDDGRSVHFGLLENHALGPRLVACIRRILKSEDNSRPLPIEVFYPEVFDAEPAPLGTTEASRYIARHEDLRVQSRLSMPLFAAYTAHVLGRGLGTTFGVVEPEVERSLEAKGVPLKRIAEPEYVPAYHADNLGIEVNMPELGRRIEARQPGTLALMRQTESGFVYFDSTMQPAPTGRQAAA